MAWDLLLKNTVDASAVAFWWKCDRSLRSLTRRRMCEHDVRPNSHANRLAEPKTP